MQAVREVSDGIYRIDVNHTRPDTTCCYLIGGGDGAALIDCGGGQRGEAAVLAALKTLALPAAAVQVFAVTHAHLDHAGAAGQLMRHLPQATFAAHPDGLKHLINPAAALEPASRALYGDTFFQTYYGGLTGVPAARARALTDGEILTFGNRNIQVLYTPGHAWHHVSFYDAAAAFVAAGDAYGISYSYGKNRAGEPPPLVVPVTPPSQFNPPAMCDSLGRLQALNAASMGLAHFDTLDMTADADLYYRRQLLAVEEWQTQAAELFAEAPEQFEARMKTYLLDWISSAAEGEDAAVVRERHAMDTTLSAAGFAYYMKKITAAAQGQQGL